MNKEKLFQLRMDKNLYQQLKRYADKNDEGLASVSARKALREFLKSDFKQAKDAETLELEGYKDQPTTLTK